MTRVGLFDGEIGRGRQRDGDDSSSSHESSPAHARSFSPVGSDDDNTVIEPTKGNDDTPPPTKQPVIRKSLAFLEDPPTQVAVSTYEPTVTRPTRKGFLPGQEVILPAKPKTTSKRNKTGIKRPRKPDAYPGQTSRFRLDTYDPTPSVEPPIAHGNGPYSSMYRGVLASTVGQETAISSEVGQVALPNSDLPLATTSNEVHLSQSRTSELLTMDGKATIHGITYHSGSLETDSAPVPRPTSLTQQFVPQKPTQPPISTLVNRNTPPASSITVDQRSVSSHNPQLQPLGSTSTGDSLGHTTFITDTNLMIRERTSPGPHYRRDYNDREMTPPSGSRQSSITTNSKSSTSESPAQKKANRGPLRIVTLLIEDIRSHEPDSQLAEVKVPLKRSDDEDDGWWADAKDIAEQLQSGPSRIDGPARAFTMRGKYRQFILRVTAENKDEFVSANVAISIQKTLDVTVELLHPPGIVPRPPPRNSFSNLVDDRHSDDYMEIDSVHSRPSGRKRASSSSFDEYDNFSARSAEPRNGSNKMPRHAQWNGSPRLGGTSSYARDRHSIASTTEHNTWGGRHGSPPGVTSKQPSPPSYSSRYTRRISSPISNLQTSHSSSSHIRSHQMTASTTYPLRADEQDEYTSADEPLIRAVDRLLHEDSDMWDAYFRASAGCRVGDVVKQYDLVTKMINMWVGRRPPGFHEIINESHIARALEIEDAEAFLSKCHETMSLLELYGKRGRIHEDSRVVNMINDQRPPVHGVDPARQLLRLLRAIDHAWKDDRSGSMLNGIDPPGPDPYDRPGPYSPEPSHPAPKTSGPPPLSLTTPASRQHSYRNTHTRSHSLSSRPATPRSESADSNTSDAARYVSRGKGMFVD